ncbi:hypothetical protein AAHZ94_31970 [Streptomyces sp. HSW2009]|uniref:hypothetical protein n=1 Tax=Streptomyces sp. HSW2009 TaxID=3142890 RepID=UPI0032EEE6BA
MDQKERRGRGSRPVSEMQFHVIGYGHGKIHAGSLTRKSTAFRAPLPKTGGALERLKRGAGCSSMLDRLNAGDFAAMVLISLPKINAEYSTAAHSLTFCREFSSSAPGPVRQGSSVKTVTSQCDSSPAAISRYATAFQSLGVRGPYA